jgi:hypothetical protein
MKDAESLSKALSAEGSDFLGRSIHVDVSKAKDDRRDRDRGSRGVERGGSRGGERRGNSERYENNREDRRPPRADLKTNDRGYLSCLISLQSFNYMECRRTDE